MKSKNLIKISIFAALSVVVIFLIWKYRHFLDLNLLAEKESQIIELRAKYGLWIPILAYVFYSALTGLSLPGALILTLVYGWYFKFWLALLIVSLASTSGATIAFLLSRYLFKETVENKFGEKARIVQEKLNEEGPYYLFSLRLIPLIPFFAINLLMGISRIKIWTFWWVSQIGMLPGTAVIVLAGSGVPSLKELAEKGTSGIVSPSMILGFILLGLFPIIAKKAMGFFEAKLKKNTPE